MPLKYKIDVLEALANKGINTYKLRTQKILSQSTIQNLRDGLPISWVNIATICSLLECQPGDIIEFVVDPAEK